MHKFIRACAFSACGLLASVSAHATTVPVDLELQLLVDVSGSISDGEFNLQRDGYENAFRNDEILAAIQSGDIGSIAVQLIYWSSSSRQEIAVDWTQISDATSANDFADLIAIAERPFRGGTRIDSAIDFGAPLFEANMFDAPRQVIDISGDGTSSATRTRDARDNALALGVDTINALAIGGMGLADFFTMNVIGGDGAFTVIAESFEDFGEAIVDKLGREIGPVIPVPGALPLMVTALAGFAFSRRRKKSA